MARRPVLRLLVLLAALAVLLPVASAAASCSDCLWETSTDCCPPSCCPCCVHGPALAGVARAVESLAAVGLAGNAVEARTLPSAPCAVFHVPKSFPI